MWEHVSTRGQCVEPWLVVPNVTCTTDADCNDGNTVRTRESMCTSKSVILPAKMLASKCSIDTCNTRTGECSNTMQPNCCGNDVCEVNETECSMDCGPFTLNTLGCTDGYARTSFTCFCIHITLTLFHLYFTSCSAPAGIMFDVIGLQNITIESLRNQIYQGAGNITVFTAPGSYTDKRSDPEKWSIVAQLSYNITGNSAN